MEYRILTGVNSHFLEAFFCFSFTKEGARENRPPRGVEKSMLIFEKDFLLEDPIPSEQRVK
jgi:hypothetical protein